MGKKELSVLLLGFSLVGTTIGCKELPVIDRDGDGVVSKKDCDDMEATVYPGAPEYCDGLDNNCDGATDTPDALDAPEWYVDLDLDGFGDPATVKISCAEQTGRINIGGDCDDTNPLIHPGAVETCDGKDNDCDPATNETGRASWTDGVDTEDLTPLFSAGTRAEPAFYVAEKAGELQLCKATFFAHIEVRTNLLIVGRTEADLNILDGGSQVSVVRVIGTNTEVTIERITIQNGAAVEEDESGVSYGGGVSCEGDVLLRLRHSVIRDSTAQNGGALGNDGCIVEITDTRMEHNEALTNGGALFQNTGSIHLEESLLEGNVGNFDGGGLHMNGGVLTVSDSEFHQNESKRGGAISLRTGSALFEGSLLRANKATVGGAVFLEGFLGPAHVDFQGTILRQNEAFSGAGMVLMYDSGASCTGSPEAMGGFVQNTASEGGGILVLDSIRDLVFESTHCTFGSTDLNEENAPNDLEYFGGNSYSELGPDASLTCTTVACSGPNL